MMQTRLRVSVLALFLLGMAPAPGAINPAVTQATIKTTICVSGYTKTIRPPVSYTDALKRKLMISQHLAGKPSDYELDHMIPLELGGHPRALTNLWMQPIAEAYKKDAAENYLHAQVCAGKLLLVTAQYQIVHNWRGVFTLITGVMP